MSVELPENEKNLSEETPENVTETAEERPADPFAAFENPEFRTKEDLEGSKKRKKTILLISLISAFVVLATLIVLLVFVFPKAEEEPVDPTVNTTVTLFDKSTSEVDCAITSATIKFGETTVEFVNIDDALFVKGYEKFEMHPLNMGDLVDALTVCTLSKDLGDMTEMSQFGFDKPQATVTVTFRDGTTKAFEVGDMTPDQSGCYFREKDGVRVYIQPLETTAILLQPPLDYVSTTVMAEPEFKAPAEGETEVVLRKVALSGSVRKDAPFSFRLVTSDDSDTYIYYSYIITEPFVKGANSSFDTALNAFSSIEAKSVVNVAPTAADLAAYGFTNPYSVAEFTLSARTSVTMEATDGNTVSNVTYNDLEKHTVTIGSKNDTYYYVRIDDNPIIYLVAADQLPFAEMKYSDFADKLLFLEDIAEMGQFRVTLPGKETVFNLAHDDTSMDTSKNLTVTANGKTYDTMGFRYLIQNFMNISRYGDLRTDVSGLEKKLEIAITRREKTTPVLTATFYEVSSSQYAVILSNGEKYQVKASDAKNAITQYENYLAGKTVLY